MFGERSFGAVITILALAFAHTGAGGQTLSIPAGESRDQIVAAAEAEGVTFPRLPAPRGGAVAPRTCATGHEIGPAYSGEFTIGGNLSGYLSMRAGHVGKVWWAPVHNALDMPPLVVRGRSLSHPADTVRFTTERVAWPVTPGVPVPEAERKYFFPSGITIPHPGRWLVIATSGSNWGCFILSVS